MDLPIDRAVSGMIGGWVGGRHLVRRGCWYMKNEVVARDSEECVL